MKILILVLCIPAFAQNFQPGGSKISWLHNHNAIIGNGIAAAWDFTSKSNVAMLYPDISSPTGVTLQAGNMLTFPAGSSSFTPGATGLALSGLGGVTGCALAGTGLSFSTGASISLLGYAKPATLSGTRALVSRASGGSAGYGLLQDPGDDKSVYLQIDSGYWEGTTPASTSAFTDWIGTASWSGSTYNMAMYANGAKEPQDVANPSATLTSAGVLSLGNVDNSASPNCYQGTIAYGAMWAKALLPYEASEIDRVVRGYKHIARPPAWMLSTFINSAGNEKLYVFYGYDGGDGNSNGGWFATTTAEPVYTPAAGVVRDPALTVYNSAYYVAHTASSAWSYTPETFFGLATSSNGVSWSAVGSGEVSPAIPGLTDVWMGRWYVPCGSAPSLLTNCESGGATWYIPLTVDLTAHPSESDIHNIYLASTTNPGSTSSWSFASNAINGPSTGTDYIDAQMLCLTTCSGGSGSYVMLIKNDTTGVKDIELWGCSSACLSTGVWTQLASGNWAGWAGSGLDNIEAPNAFRLADRWRMYFYDVTNATSYFSDCFQPGSVCFSAAGGSDWTSRQVITPNGQVFYNGSIISGAIGL